MPFDRAIEVKKSLIAERKQKSAGGVVHATGRIEVKSVTEDPNYWWIEGTATTPKPDYAKDVVNPMGLKFRLPMPLLWMHVSDKPIGQVTFAKPTARGVPYKARIPKVKEAGLLKDRIDEAVHSIQYELVRDTSIGFMPDWDAVELNDHGGLTYDKATWVELSVCTIGMNQDANIVSIKSLHQSRRTELSAARSAAVPGASGNPSGQSAQSINRSTKGKDMPAISMDQQLADFQKRRTEVVERMKEIGDLWQTDGYSRQDAERKELHDLEAERGDLDDDILIARSHSVNISRAQPIGKSGPGQRPGASGYVFQKGADKDETFKGQNFTRKLIAKAAAKLDGRSPGTVAEERWGKTNPTLVQIIKANEVPGGGTGSGEWGSELVQADTRYTGDFIEFLYAATVFDKLALREIPPNVMVKGQDGQATAYWRGESKAIPPTTADFMDVSLSPLEIGALAVVSNQLIRYSMPSAELLVRDALVNASAQRIDSTFLSADNASAGVSPAGMLNGLSGSSVVSVSGTDSAALRADILKLYKPFIDAHNARNLVLVTTPELAKAIGLMVNALNIAEFPGLGAEGGILLGDTVITGDNVPSGYMILMKPSDIYEIGDSGVMVDLSTDATIEQNSLPTGATDTPVAATLTMTNMFQSNSTAIRVVRYLNFAKRRASAVSYVSAAHYGGATS
jgi:HK97 family phage major capsid protein